MVELFQMWAMVEVLGLVCLPLTVTVFHNLPDRGWAFSKALGILVLAFCVWFPLMCIQALPFSQLSISVILLLLLGGCLSGFWRGRRTLLKAVRRNLPYVLITELIFLGMVFLLGWLRSLGPAININEMFMDEGFISAIMRSPHLPPNDMWLSGYSINYYYYAHFTIAMLAKLLGQAPSIAFNTGICIFFGLTAVNLFGVTCNIVAWARYLRVRRNANANLALERPDIALAPLFPAIPYGLLSVLVGQILGNLASTQDWFKSHGDAATYDWYGPSRVIPDTINEFPAFSFLLSCFHAHVLALAFTIMAIGLAFNLFLEFDGKGLFVFGRGWRLPLTLGLSALILGALFTMNGWDYPTYLGLALVCMGLQQWLAHHSRLSPALFQDIFVTSASLIALSLLLYLPFYLNFVSPSLGIGIVTVQERSPLGDELLIYGLFAFVFISLLLASAFVRPLFEEQEDLSMSSEEQEDLSISSEEQEDLSVSSEEQDELAGEDADDQKSRATQNFIWAGWFSTLFYMLLMVLILVIVPNSLTFVASGSIAVLGVVLLLSNLRDRAHSFTLLLGVVAFVLVAGCEIFYLKDVFAGQMPRMNTVFKFYFQAWALLSIASGAGLFFILDSFLSASISSFFLHWVQRGILVLWSLCLLALLLAGMAYPLDAPYARYSQIDPATQLHRLVSSSSLDGLSYLQHDPALSADYYAIRWLNANIQGDPVIVEATGGEYTTYGRLSAFTGLPTLLGWGGHEYQWRVNWLNNVNNNLDFGRRSADIDLIYTSKDSRVVLGTMGRYHALYLYVGPLEYAKYSTSDLHRFGTFMQVVYNADGATIYKIRLS